LIESLQHSLQVGVHYHPHEHCLAVLLVLHSWAGHRNTDFAKEDAREFHKPALDVEVGDLPQGFNLLQHRDCIRAVEGRANFVNERGISASFTHTGYVAEKWCNIPIHICEG
jgi:hypothetical protein